MEINATPRAERLKRLKLKDGLSRETGTTSRPAHPKERTFPNLLSLCLQIVLNYIFRTKKTLIYEIYVDLKR